MDILHSIQTVIQLGLAIFVLFYVFRRRMGFFRSADGTQKQRQGEGPPGGRWKKAALMSVPSLMLVGVFVLMFWGMIAYRPLDGSEIFFKSIPLSVPLLLVFLFYSARLLRGQMFLRRTLFWLALFSAVAFPLFFHNLGVVMNGRQDTRRPRDHVAKVLNKYAVRNKNSTAYHVEVESWGKKRKMEHLRVSSRLYDSLVPGKSRLNIRTSPGALECEWIRAVQLADTDPFRAGGVQRVGGLTVEQAFGTMNVVYIPFDASLVRMVPAEKAFFEGLFQSIDSAIVARVRAMAGLEHNQRMDDLIAEYQRAKEEIRGLNASERLKPVQDLVLQAMEEQDQFLQKWNQMPALGNKLQFARHPLVQSSSSKLRRAYQELLDLYPQENEGTKATFHNELCALDFI